MPLLVPLSPESHVRGTVFEAWGCAPPTRTSDGRRIRRRIDDVRPLPNPIDSYVRSTESRKYAKHAGELVDANLVITLNFNTDVNLVDLVRRAPVALWMMRPAVVIKLSNPRVTCLLFASGKALLVGVRSEAHGLLAAWHAALFLRQLRVPDAAVHDFVVRNVTSTAYVGGLVNLLRLSRHPGPLHDADFASNVFPGVYMRQKAQSHNITVAVFYSGKCNVTGCLTARQTEREFNMVLPRIRYFRVFDPIQQKLLLKRGADDRKEQRLRGAEREMEEQAMKRNERELQKQARRVLQKHTKAKKS